MDKGTRQVKRYIRYQKEIRALMDMGRLEFKVVDTRNDNCFTVAEDETPEFLMYKLKKGYFGA